MLPFTLPSQACIEPRTEGQGAALSKWEDPMRREGASFPLLCTLRAWNPGVRVGLEEALILAHPKGLSSKLP